MQILLGDLNEKLWRKFIFKPIFGNKSLHQYNTDHNVRRVKFATSTIQVFESAMFPHRNIHTYSWSSPDGKTHNQIDHILIDRRWDASILDVRSFRGADRDTDHCLVFAEVREILEENNRHKFDVARFNLKKLRDLEVMKRYQIKISKRFAALEKLKDSEDINRFWKNIAENIKSSAKKSLGLYEWRQHNPWRDVE